MSTTNQHEIYNEENIKILNMIKSDDIEMVKLGIILLLDKEEEWISENIPAFGPEQLPDNWRTDPKLSQISCNINERIRLKKDRIGVYIGGRHGCLDARYLWDHSDKECFIEV